MLSFYLVYLNLLVMKGEYDIYIYILLSKNNDIWFNTFLSYAGPKKKFENRFKNPALVLVKIVKVADIQQFRH